MQRLEQPRLRAISLGAGVQSTTLCLMAAHGEVGPMPDVAIFADTGSEPSYVYETLDWLSSPNVLPFPVRRIKAGDLRDDIINGRYGPESKTYPAIPYHIDSQSKGGGRGLRACTGPYKMLPIAREHRRILDVQPFKNLPPNSVEVWIGISLDEVIRMKPAPREWQTNRWPLIEQKMTRGDCIQWLKRHDYPVPHRSACVFCPYRSDAEWVALKQRDPAGFKKAVDLDYAIRENQEALRLRSPAYLHRSKKPLDQVKFKVNEPQIDLFGNECNGICST